MCTVAVQTTMAAQVLCQQSDDRCDKDITIKTPADHEYSESAMSVTPMILPQSGNVASTNTNQVIPIKLVPVNRQGLLLEQGKQIMVKSLEVPADNATTKPASISTASVGMPTAIGHLLQGNTNDISMNQREVSGDNQAALCAARADINTKSICQSDSRVPDLSIEVQPSHPKIPRITGLCSVDGNSKDAVSFPRHQEDGKSGKCNQSDTSQIPTPRATEKFILVKLTPQGGKGQGDGTSSSIKYLAVPTKKSGLNAEQANLSEGKGTDCNKTVPILNGNPSLITPSGGGRGTKRSSGLALNEIGERTESTKRCFVTQQTTNTTMSKDASSNYITDVAKAIDSNIQSTVRSTNTDKSMVLVNTNISGNSSNPLKIKQLIPVQIFPEGPGGSKRGCHIKYIGITADEEKQSSDSYRHKNGPSENDSICNQTSDSALTQKKHRVPNILKRRNISANVHFSGEESDIAKVNDKFVEKLNSNKQTVPETVTVEPEHKMMGRKQKIQNCESNSQSGGLEISNLDESSYPDTISSDEEVPEPEEISNPEIPTVRFHLETEASVTGPGHRWTAVRESNGNNEMPTRSNTVLTSTESQITGPPEAPEISAEKNETSPENHSSDGELSEHINDGKPNIASSKALNMDKSPQETPIVSTSSKQDSTGDTGNSDDCSENVLKEPSSEHMTETESGDHVQPTIPTVRFQLTTKPGPKTPSLNCTKMPGDTISSNPRSGPAEDKVLPDQLATVTTVVTATPGEPTGVCDSQTENSTIRVAKSQNADKILSRKTIQEDRDFGVDQLTLPDYLHDKNKLSVETHEDVNESDTQPVQHASSTHCAQEVVSSLTAATAADMPLKSVISSERAAGDKQGDERSLFPSVNNRTTFTGIPPSKSKTVKIIYKTSGPQFIKLVGPLSCSTDGSAQVSNSGHISEEKLPPPERSIPFHAKKLGTRTQQENMITPISAPCSLPIHGSTPAVAIKNISSGDMSKKCTPSAKGPIEKLSQDCISQQNVSTQTLLWIKKPSKSSSKQNSRTSDVLATADTPSSQGQSNLCPDIEAVKSAPPSDKTQPQLRQPYISTARNSLADMLKEHVRIPLQVNQHKPEESAQSAATVVDASPQKLPKQDIPMKIIPSHNIFRITKANQSLPVKQKINNPPKEVKKCPVVLKSEPALQLNQFLEKKSCYIPNVQSGSSIGALVVDGRDIRDRKLRWARPGLCHKKRKPTLKTSTEGTESTSSLSKGETPSQSWKDSDPVLNEIETLKAERNVDAIEVTPDGQRLILKKDLLCMICSQQFEKPEVLAAHVMVSHFKFKCQVCLTIFTKRELYLQHMKGSHCFQRDGRLCGPSFRCGDCWNSYPRRATLDRHQLRQHGVDIRCSICEKTFPTFGPLHHHLIMDHCEKSWVCDLCEKPFPLEYNMLKHRKRHNMEKTFLCPTCGKCFKEASTLRDHVDIHKPKGERQYRFMCSYCGKRFNCRPIFQDHVNTHTGKTPYACKSCDLTFSRLANLKKHEIYKHSDKKPFVCEICSRAFKMKPALKAHMVTHTGVSKYKCTYCQRSFGNNGILKAHVERCKKKHPTQVKEAEGVSLTEEASIIVEQLNELGESSNLCEVISASRVDEAEVDTDINRTLSEPFVYMCTACNHQFDDMITADMHIKLCNGTGV